MKLLLLALILALTFRLVFTLYTGEPYYVDSWPLIGGAYTYAYNSSARILDDRFYDGYNNRWPSAIIITGLLSIITDIDPVTIGRLLGPSMGFIAIIAFYALASRFSSKLDAILATIIASTAGTLFVFESGLTKEVIARPLVILYIVVTLYFKSLLSLLILALGLVLTHHVSTLVVLAILISIIVLNMIYILSKSYTLIPLKRVIISLAILVVLAVIHYYIVAPSHWRLFIELSDITRGSFYAITSLSIPAFMWFIARKPSLRHRLVFALVIASTFTIMLLLTILAPPPPQTPPLGLYVILYATPLILSPLFATTIKAMRSQAVIIGGWLAGTGSLMAYSAFSGDPAASAAIHRYINYTLYGVLLAYTVCSKRILIVQVILVVLAAPIIAYNIVEGTDPYFHFTLHYTDEILAVKLALKYGEEAYGDSKVWYIATLLEPKPRIEPPPLELKAKKPLIINRENIVKGYWVSGVLYGDPGEIEKLKIRENNIYNSGKTSIILKA